MKRAMLTASFLILTSATQAQSPVPVTVDNFGRAESDLYFGNGVKDAGGIGKLFHHREPMAIDKQGVIRFKQIGPVTPEVLQDKILPLARKLQG